MTPKILQITSQEEGRVHWMVDTVFDHPDALWEALVASHTTGEPPRRLGDSICASIENLRAAEAWHQKQIAQQDAQWREIL